MTSVNAELFHREYDRRHPDTNEETMKTIDIVFDGPPSHDMPRLVEVEREGKSISIGEWVQRDDGYWALRIPDPGSQSKRFDSLQSRLAYEAKCIEHDVSSRSVHAILLEASDAIGSLFRRVDGTN